MDKQPLVSVIVPCYNKERYIERTLSSLRSQSYANFEVQIVDDCSTDASWSIVQRFVSEDPRFHAERNAENRGGDYCRNRGFALSKGEYLIFLDADDWLAEDCIAVRVSEMLEDSAGEFDMIVFPSISDRNGRLFNLILVDDTRDALLEFLRQDSPWQTMMPIWRREAFDRLGGFDENFARRQDVELFARALLSGIRSKAAKRKTADCFYCDEDGRLMQLDRLAEKATVSTLMFIDKMRGLVKTRAQIAALGEAELVALRTVGDIYQMGGADRALRDALYDRVLSRPGVSAWVHLYACCYRLKVNKLKGFNFLYIRFYRIFTY